jgi:hypothetical protein
MAAVAKGDKQTAAALLGADFTWTDADGVTRDKTASLDKFAGPGDETDLQAHFYGRVFAVRGARNKLHFLRIWVKRDDRWQAFVLLETPVAPRSGPASARSRPRPDRATATIRAGPCPTHRRPRWTRRSSPRGRRPR